MHYQGKTEYLYLPEEDISIEKALGRLGTPCLSDCTMEMEIINCPDECWRDRLETNFEIAGLHQANCLAEVLARPSIDLHKLLCVTDYSDVVCGEDIRKLADHLDDFIFIKGVETPADVGEYITQHENGYPYEALDLPDYFPRLYQKFVEPEQRLSCINHWNYDDPVIWETRLAGPSPKPESKNILEMGGM
jgi:hypothetical protein